MSSTFSESWHRVAHSRLALLSSVAVHKQRFRGRDWYVMRDGFTQRFFRISPQAYAFVSRLNGEQTVDEVWQTCLREMPDQAPGQEEVMQVLSQLHQSNLLHFTTKADSQVIFDRYQEFKRKEFQGKLLSFLSVRIPRWDPNPWLNRHRTLVDRVVSWPVALIFLALGFIGLWTALSHSDELVSRSAGIFATDNLLWLYACMAAMKVLHEFGHAFVVKRFGGDVHSMGVMFLVLVPLPYVDATGSWMFRSRGAKALTGAAGIIVELVLASIATMVWVNTGAGLVNSLAFNVMVLGSISSLVFNGNPLLRFDAYYVLADLLGIPNMYQKATKQWTYFADKYLLGTPQVESPALDAREWWWLTSYGLASYVYRVLIFLSIWLVVTDNWFGVGVAFGVTTLFLLVVMPMAKWFGHLRSPALARNRRRAVTVSLALLLVPILLVSKLQLPDAMRAPGVLEATQHTRVTSQSGGVLTALDVADGAVVRKGEVLVRLQNHELQLELEAARAQVREVIVMRNLALEQSPVEVAALEERLRASQEKLDLLLERQSQLVITARHDGVWSRGDLQVRQNNWLARGAPLGELTSDLELRFSAVVSQEQADLLFKEVLSGAEIKINGQNDTNIVVKSLVLLPYQRHKLQTPALGWTVGGSIPTKADDPDGLTTIDPYYEVLAIVENIPADLVVMHGMTGWLRIPIAPTTLWERWEKAWRQLVQKRYQF